MTREEAIDAYITSPDPVAAFRVYLDTKDRDPR